MENNNHLNDNDLNRKFIREQMVSAISILTGKDRDSLEQLSFEDLRKKYLKATNQTERKYEEVIETEIAKKDAEARQNGDDAWLMLSRDEKIIALGILLSTYASHEDLEEKVVHEEKSNKQTNQVEERVKELLEQYDALLKDNEEQQKNFIAAEEIINDREEPSQNKADARIDRLSAKESTRRNNKKIANIINELLIFEVPLSNIVNKMLSVGNELMSIIINDLIVFDNDLAIIIIKEMVALGIELPADITKVVEQSLK